MHRALFPLFGLMILLVSVWCSESTGPDDSNDLGSYDDWVHFDKPQFLLAGKLYDPLGEYHIDGDYSLGEPFTDVNSNGIYDRGIDIFYKCDCDSNQDLNHNEAIDGPGFYTWDLGIPYDDLNGNGFFDFPDQSYSFGEPFCDANLNDTIDPGYINRLSSPGYWQALETNEIDTIYALLKLDSVWKHTSDSGISFYMPTHSQIWDNLNDRPELVSPFIVTVNDSGLYWTGHYSRRDQAVELFLSVLSKGLIVNGSTQLSVTDLSHPDLLTTCTRTITSNATYSWDGRTYKHLLKIQLDKFSTSSEVLNELLVTLAFEFYFDRELGLVGITTIISDNGTTEERVRAFITSRIDTIPLPMTKLEIPHL